MPTSSGREPQSLKRLDLSLTYGVGPRRGAAEGTQPAGRTESVVGGIHHRCGDGVPAGKPAAETLEPARDGRHRHSLAYIGELSQLKSLDISFTQITDVGLEHLASLAQLEELNLGGNKITGASLHVLEAAAKLRKLSFYRYPAPQRPAGLGAVVTIRARNDLAAQWARDLTSAPGVALARHGQAISVPRTAKRNVASPAAPASRSWTCEALELEKLQHLRSRGSAIRRNGLKSLANLRDLRRLSLWNVKGIDDTAAPFLESLTNLTSLDLSNTAVGDETLGRLSN